MQEMRTLTLLATMLLGSSCGGDGDGSPDAGSTQLSLDCPTYCSEIAKTCTGDNAQYQDDTHCMAMCAKFTPGAKTDIAGNTLGCRNYHIQNITVLGQSPSLHCDHAGPLGGQINPAVAERCGDPCTDFCALDIATCGVAGTDATGQYASVDGCIALCRGDRTAANPGYALTHLYTYGAAPPAGDSLACRMYHLTNAAQPGLAATHCPYTGPSGGGSAEQCMRGSAPTP